MDLKFMAVEEPEGHIFTRTDDTETIYLVEDLTFHRKQIERDGLASHICHLFSSLDEVMEARIEADLSHETIHNVLNKYEGYEATCSFDNIDGRGEITFSGHQRE